ncbi:hypothetical protein N2600_02140 [Rhizobium sp. WSM1274]|uniref:hypothetical protein n=1 Tax=Rhizobium sp. WSM1274 TaxID=3138254 RepID=UPI0021A3C24D|nr:hypothetical protein [Rhizobium leguminosarum]UWU28797.1 hypothetical protein N2600_02140 [Rhizobium leguminosarum bv. viciae]
MSVGIENILRQGRNLFAISHFTSAEVKLMRRARPSAGGAILDDVGILERD